MFYIKKEFTKSSLALYLSLILVIGSLLQISSTDFFENNDHILIKIPSIYAQEGDNGDDKIMTSAAFDIDNNNTLTSIHKPILYLLPPDFPGVECGLPGAFCENGVPTVPPGLKGLTPGETDLPSANYDDENEGEDGDNGSKNDDENEGEDGDNGSKDDDENEDDNEGNGATSLVITFTGDISQIEEGVQIKVLNKGTGDFVNVHTLKDYDPTDRAKVELNRAWPVGTDYMVCVGQKNSDRIITCQEYNIVGTGERQIEFNIGSTGGGSGTTSSDKTPKVEISPEQQLRQMGIGYNDYNGDGITCAFTDAYANYFIKLILDSQRLLGKQITPEYVEELKERYYPPLTPQYIQKIKDCEQAEKGLLPQGSSPSIPEPLKERTKHWMEEEAPNPSAEYEKLIEEKYGEPPY